MILRLTLCRDGVMISLYILLHFVTLKIPKAAVLRVSMSTLSGSLVASPRFKSPRPVMALKFCTALVSLINAAPKPGALKTAVETIGFQHLDVETWSKSIEE